MSLRMSFYNRIAGENRERLAALSDGVSWRIVIAQIALVQLDYAIASGSRSSPPR
jgi:hypothetical protein